MDPVRFGRALGIGARLAAQTAAQIAAKTAATAVDAALAPNPSSAPATSIPPARTTGQPANARRAPTSRTAGQPGLGSRPAGPSSAQPQPTRASQPPTSPARQNARRLTQALTGPLRRLSGVLWLEFTGVFFSLFAAAAALGAWRLRAAWRPTPANATNHLHFLLTAAVAAVFTYFCTSSFLRAGRRNRQP